jgi:hypothetical protein
VSDGYGKNIHVLVVSRRFDKLPDQEQREILWGPIDGSDLDEEERSLISLLMPLSPGLLE